MNILAIILSIALFSTSSSKVEGWKGIVVLHSTRADVERLLGPPVRPCKSSCSYDTRNEGVFVLYSGNTCENGEQNRWRVPPDTVISLTVYAIVKPKLSDLKLNLRKFAKTEDPELRGYLTYTNVQEGITYEVSDKGVVLGIEWFPTSKDDETLRCPLIGTSTSTENVQLPVLYPHTSVGLTFEEDKHRLDQFASSLKKVPNGKAYIIAYGADRGLASEARMRLKCIGDYMKITHQISPSRLIMIDGGYTNEVNVTLYLVQPGEPTPKPAPTRKLTAVRNIKPRTDPCR